LFSILFIVFSLYQFLQVFFNLRYIHSNILDKLGKTEEAETLEYKWTACP